MGPYLIETTQSGFAEAPSLLETRYIKILRIFYVKDQKSENSSLYSSVHLTTRLFVPARPAGAGFESRSKTAQRIISWLSATGKQLYPRLYVAESLWSMHAACATGMLINKQTNQKKRKQNKNPHFFENCLSSLQ